MRVRRNPVIYSVIISNINENITNKKLQSFFTKNTAWTISGRLTESTWEFSYDTTTGDFIKENIPPTAKVLLITNRKRIDESASFYNRFIETFEDSILNEFVYNNVLSYHIIHDMLSERKIQVKRKYTDRHPEKTVGAHAPTRMAILTYINDNGGRVPVDAMNAYITQLHEADDQPSPSSAWFSKNNNLVAKKDNEFFLTSYGKKVLEKHMNYSAKK